VKAVACLLAMKTYNGSGGTAPLFLNPSAERTPGTDRIVDWINSRAGLEVLEKRKTFAPAGIRTQDRPVRNFPTILVV
jgi:hypothetical protein